MERTKGQWALVTGGSDGIGYELSKLLAKDGYNLVIVARDKAELENAMGELTKQYGVYVETIEKDLFDTQSYEQIYEELKVKGIIISILVNNAGQGEYGFFHEIPIERDHDIIHLNIMAPLALTKLFLKDMMEKGEGRILNLASLVSKNPTPLLTVYAATKAFMYSFTEALRNELKDTGITVTALLPGSTDTDFFSKAGMLNTKEYNEYNLGDPADVAKEGYEAMMKGDGKVVSSGIKNKIMATMANITPDSINTENMRKNHMQNVDGTEGKAGASPSEGDQAIRQAASQAPDEAYRDEGRSPGWDTRH